MSITIRSQGFRLTQAIRDHVISRLDKTLMYYQDQVPKVDVRVMDINGPRGGEDMRCRIILTLDGSKPLVIQETAEDLYDAISECCHRAKWAVSRHFERLQKHKRQLSHRVNRRSYPEEREGRYEDEPIYAGAM